MATVARGALGKLQRQSTALFVCDIQERFRSLISGMPAVIDNSRRLIRGASVLGLPVCVTEQYPAKLGATVPELRDVLPPNTSAHAKTLFSMLTPDVEAFLAQHSSVRQVVLVGIETHVCVLQTTLDLIEKGYEVHIVTDAVSSQRLADREVALTRLAQSGAFMATSEMALFQLAKDASAPYFKEISALAREPRMDLPHHPASRI